MTRRWFGTDGIRGEAGVGPLALPFLLRLGRALGEQVLEEARAAGAQPGAVLIARDTRESGPAITTALADGLRTAGVDTLDLGVLPTAGLPMAMRESNAPRGVVVSASHNPWADNGVKLFGPGGHKLTDEQEHGLEARIASLGGESEGDVPAEFEAPAPSEPPPERDGATDYIRAMLDRFNGVELGGLRLAVDCAHGAAASTAPFVLKELGADVIALFCEPNGRNINRDCGSTHMQRLSDRVADGGFDLGMAFDGDADRVLLVDGTGRLCTGDHMMGFLASWFFAEGKLPRDTLVTTVMSNLGLERMLSAQGVHMLRTSVGDRYVKQAMREGGYALGGEDSGHLLFGEEHDYTGDGLYTALRVLQGLTSTSRDLASVIDAVPRVPQRLLNVPVAARPPVAELAELNARVTALEAEHGDALRIVLRYSGTENLARVMVEGLDGEVVDSSTDELAEIWAREILQHGSPTS
ncbi:MAG: phosphoglucosamine mutase [Planctomycetota bacterium]|nr:MAG: phosphoglucosamine mutase [Planctomycetota bacterium]